MRVRLRFPEFLNASGDVGQIARAANYFMLAPYVYSEGRFHTLALMKPSEQKVMCRLGIRYFNAAPASCTTAHRMKQAILNRFQACALGLEPLARDSGLSKALRASIQHDVRWGGLGHSRLMIPDPDAYYRVAVIRFLNTAVQLDHLTTAGRNGLSSYGLQSLENVEAELGNVLERIKMTRELLESTFHPDDDEEDHFGIVRDVGNIRSLRNFMSRFGSSCVMMYAFGERLSVAFDETAIEEFSAAFWGIMQRRERVCRAINRFDGSLAKYLSTESFLHLRVSVPADAPRLPPPQITPHLLERIALALPPAR